MARYVVTPTSSGPGHCRRPARTESRSLGTSRLTLLARLIGLVMICWQSSGDPVVNTSTGHSASHHGPRRNLLQSQSNYMSEAQELALQFLASQAATAAIQTKVSGADSLQRSATPHPLRIKFDTAQMDDGGSLLIADTMQLIHSEVLPAAAAVLGTALRVKDPLAGPLKVAPVCRQWATVSGQVLCQEYYSTSDSLGYCSQEDGVMHTPEVFGAYELCSSGSADSCEVYKGMGNTAYIEADAYVYVIADQTKCAEGELAHAGACGFDVVTGRPILGWVNFCPVAVDEQERTAVDLTRVTVRELLHMLYFSDPLMANLYTDAQGDVYSNSDKYGTDNEGRVTVKTPKVLEMAREFFGCPTVAGVPLSVDGSHWDGAVVRGDVMSPGTEEFGRSNFGPLTMALAEDSGWYEANWASVGHTPYGFQEGCSHLSRSCEASSDDSCSSSTQLRCSHDSTFFGLDKSDGSSESCSAVHKPITYHSSAGQIAADCRSPVSASASDGMLGNYFGAGSRCIEASGYVQSPDMLSVDWPKCMQMTCSNSVLQIVVGGQSLLCPTKALIDLSQVPGWQGRVGPCPDNGNMCRTLSCPADCSANGHCLDGTCHCSIGFAGVECGESLLQSLPQFE